MPNTKNRVYTDADALRDIRTAEKKKTQQQFSRFSSSTGAGITSALNEPKLPATQIDTKPQIGHPYDDTKGSVSTNQTVRLDVYGSGYVFYEVTGNVTFSFAGIPAGRHHEFVLDILVSNSSGVTIGFDGVLNPPTLAGADDDRYVLNFSAVNRADPQGSADPVQTVTLIGNNSVDTGGFANTALSNLSSPTAVNQDLIPDASNTRDLGSSSAEWAALHVVSIEGAAMAMTGSTSITLNAPQMYIGDESSDSVGINAAVSSDIIPDASNTRDLGSSSAEWAALHVVSIEGAAMAMTGSTSITLNAPQMYIGDQSSDRVSIRADISSDIIPDANGTRDLGSSSARWGQIHVSSIQTASLGITTSASVAINSPDIYIGGNSNNDVAILGRISAHIIPSSNNARNLGASTAQFRDIHARRLTNTNDVTIEAGDEIIIDADDDITIEAGDDIIINAGDDLRIQDNGTNRLLYDGGANRFTCSSDWLMQDSKIRSSNGNEIGFFVSNYTGSIGTAGSVQMPDITTNNVGVGPLNTYFGSVDGCCGLLVVGTGRFFMIRHSGRWYGLQLIRIYG